MALTLERLEWDECPWERMDSFHDRVVFQTRPWLSFLSAAYGAEPVVCRLLDGDAEVGFFTGLVTRRLGLRILGSPLPGWTTSYMGFNLAERVARDDAVTALLQFARRSLKCAHLELRDRRLETAASEERFDTLEVDLEPGEDEILARMQSRSRNSIRKSEKLNVVVEEASDPEFADDYYTQLLDVFGKQKLSPTYGIEVVRALVEHVQPSGNLLLLRARDADGECIGTGIFPGMNRSAYFWGGASWRSRAIPPVNEALIWHAIRHWKGRGATALDLGAGDYKRKFGVRDVSVPHLVHSSLPGLGAMRSLVRLLHSERLRRLVPS